MTILQKTESQAAGEARRMAGCQWSLARPSRALLKNGGKINRSGAKAQVRRVRKEAQNSIDFF